LAPHPLPGSFLAGRDAVPVGQVLAGQCRPEPAIDVLLQNPDCLLALRLTYLPVA
jgi:hypothetical protein